MPGLVTILLLVAGCESARHAPQETDSVPIALPPPIHDGGISIEQALLERRSVREYAPAPLTLTEISQLLWSAQGITHPGGLRTAPSAGALYPLEVLLVAGEVTDLEAGIYRYKPQGHELLPILEGDRCRELSRAALNQSSLQDAPAVIAIAGVYERTTVKYGERIKNLARYPGNERPMSFTITPRKKN